MLNTTATRQFSIKGTLVSLMSMCYFQVTLKFIPYSFSPIWGGGYLWFLLENCILNYKVFSVLILKKESPELMLIKDIFFKR